MSPIIATFLRSLNDAMDDDARQTSESVQRTRVIEVGDDRDDARVSQMRRSFTRMRHCDNTIAIVQKVDDAQAHVATANN